MDQARTKIAIVSHSLGEGGAERFAGQLSFLLEGLGYEIHHIIINDCVDYQFTGTLYNLGAISRGDSGIFKKLKKGFLLRKYLREHQIGIIIDNRTRNVLPREIFTCWIYASRKKYFMVHSYYLENYLPKSVFWAKYLYDDAEKLICVSKAIENKVRQQYGLKQAKTIYNLITPPEIISDSKNLPPENYILFYGRLDEKVKNFTLLLTAFAESRIYEKGYQLLILGSGPSKTFIEDLVRTMKLDDSVQMLPFDKNPFAYVSRARFTVLTSRYEGFPMSIIESLAVGTPVISVDCQSGPAEIIKNESNGLLVENHNPKALAAAMNRLVDDGVLYETLRKNATQSIAHLSPTEIVKNWAAIFPK